MRHFPLTPHHEVPFPAVLMALILTVAAATHAHAEHLRPFAHHLHLAAQHLR